MTFSTYITAISEHMGASFIVEHSHIQVELWHLYRMRRGTVKVEALVVLLPVALVSIHHVLRPVLCLEVDSVPAGGELYVYFQL